MANSQKLRGAIIGFGFISGKGHVPAYLERSDVEIVAIADICSARREAAKAAIPCIRVYETYAELLLREKDLSFVDISTPPHAHAEIAVASLKAGLHVLCEKPLASTLAQAREMLLAAQEAERVLFPCHNYKYAPVVKAVRGAIDSGNLGGIKSLTLQTFRYTHAKGVEEWKTDWRREHFFSGGGIAMDHGSHSFYLTFDWLGGFPTHVSATTTKLDSRWDTEDTLHCVLKFPHAVANVFLTWSAGARKMIYTVEGENGAVFVNNDHFEMVRREETLENFSIQSNWMDASHSAWFNSMFDDFVHAMASRDFVGKDARDSYRCVEVIERCYQSAREESRMVVIPGDLSFLKGNR